MSEGSPRPAQADGRLRIAVVSDLHAFDDGKGSSATSWLTLSLAETVTAHHPIAALIDLIRRETIRAHYLVCAGDIGDRANPKAIKYAWAQIHRLSRELETQSVIATPGNHDVDSRKTADLDAKGYLQALVPPFPLDDEHDNDRFWSRNFVILDRFPLRVVVLNSAAYHGAVSMPGDVPEYEHGRIAASTLSALREKLKELSKTIPLPPINLLVCHHHPHKHQDLELEDLSTLKDGAKLLELLGDGAFGRWLVIHGHKHHPRLCYAGGPSSAPIVFGAGSLCAHLPPGSAGSARNQFYVIEVPWDRAATLGLELAGTFQAWDWLPMQEWRPAGPSSGLPAKGGFGYRIELSLEAKRLANHVKTCGEPFLKWDDILKWEPKYEFLMPRDRDSLMDTLERVHHVKTARDSTGGVLQVSP